MVDKSLIKNKIPIDVVIPWVNGNDSKHKKKINSYFNDKDILISNDIYYNYRNCLFDNL